jgi:hypothetical protein
VTCDTGCACSEEYKPNKWASWSVANHRSRLSVRKSPTPIVVVHSAARIC